LRGGELPFRTIQLTEKDGVARLVMNRPLVLNAMSRELAREVTAACQQIEANPENRVVVVSGTGSYFSSGGDLKDVATIITQSPEAQDPQLRPWWDMIRAVTDLEIPTIAALNGPALGGGCGLALACDMRIAAEEAAIGAIFVTLGAAAADCGVTWLLPRLIGAARAIEMMLTGEVIDAKEAERIGLYNQIVPANELAATVDSLARRIAAGPAFALKLTKRAIYRSVWHGLSEHLDYEAGLQARIFLSSDFKEAITAFSEKREPRFARLNPRSVKASK
jgi:2-(1,2-epoxy-1,2-dihydrophenyl)acetyl-CoA isomerase